MDEKNTSGIFLATEEFTRLNRLNDDSLAGTLRFAAMVVVARYQTVTMPTRTEVSSASSPTQPRIGPRTRS